MDDTSSLREADEQRRAASLRSLVAVRALSSLAFSAFVPFTPIWAERNLGTASATAAAALALSILATRTGGVLLPPVIDRLGTTVSIRLAYGAAALLAAAVALATPGGWAFAGCLLVLGVLMSGGIAATKAAAAALVLPDEDVRAFGALNVAVNAGAGIGPVVGATLVYARAALLPGATAAMLAAAALAGLTVARPRAAAASPRPPLDGAHRPSGGFVRFLAVTAPIWLGYAVAFEAMPTVVRPWVSERVVAVAFAVNAALIVAGQLSVTRLLARARARSGGDTSGPLALSFALVAVALVVLAGTPYASGAAVVGGIAVFTAGELCWSPLLDVEITRRRGRLSPAAAFGLAGLAWGVVESVGAYGGVALAGRLPGASSAAVFVVAAATVVAGAVLLAASRRPRPVTSGAPAWWVGASSAAARPDPDGPSTASLRSAGFRLTQARRRSRP